MSDALFLLNNFPSSWWNIFLLREIGAGVSGKPNLYVCTKSSNWRTFFNNRETFFNFPETLPQRIEFSWTNCGTKLFYKFHLRACLSNVFFSTQPQYCLTFSWIELQMLLRCCLMHINIILLRSYFLYLVYLCPCLD